MELRDWSTPRVDLNLRHYSGKPTDVLKQVQNEIVDYLQSGMATQKQREVYSAIYNAINLYKEITYLPGADYNTDNTYLSYTIKYFNEDFNHLAKQYNTPDHPNTVTAQARIKSPIKFIEKIMQKVDEYEEEGRDYRYFNESLRDIIGVKFVINPPADIKSKGPHAESDFFYDIFYDLMKYRGINNPDDEKPGFGQYRFLDVNTRYDPHKLERLKARPNKKGFDRDVIEKITPKFYVPDSRPSYMERESIDSKVKDYHMWPKELGYQGVHTCVIPDFAYSLEHLDLPTCIIPPATRDYAIEYQFRTNDEDYHAEHGIASHEKKYKPGEKASYHRLLVPFYIAFDEPSDETEDTYKSSSQNTPSKDVHEYYKRTENILKLRNFGESFKKFYGHSFEDYFGVPFKRFRDSFTSREKNMILAGTTRVKYDSKTNRYICEDTPQVVFLDEGSNNISSMLRIPGSDEAHKLMDELELSDNIYEIYSDAKGEVFSKVKTPKANIKAFSVRSMNKPKKEESVWKKYQDEDAPEY